MRISQLISLLEDAKEYYGDEYIWSFDADSFPCPNEIEVELTSLLKRTDFGMKGGKADEQMDFTIYCEYEEGVDLLDRSFETKEKW